jgi:2-phospho-L-lactate/phosphoenolpyruvate guanylyltransferase
VIRIAAIIPVGTLAGAKSRLGERLDAEEREDLVQGLLARTVLAATAVDRLDDVLVASPDRDVLRRAADLGARTLRQRTRGLNAGLDEARADVVAGGADAILVLPIDLPFVTSDAIDAILAPLTDPAVLGGARAVADTGAGVGAPTAIVVLVTDRHGSGTNALGLRPPGIIDFAFGPGSRRAHRASAEAAGAIYVEVGGPLTVDLDTPDDFVLVESIETEGVGAG